MSIRKYSLEISASWRPPLLLLLLFCVQVTHAQYAYCREPKILAALKRNMDNGSDIFCAQFVESISYVGTLREDPTYFFYATKTDRRSTELIYKLVTTTVTEHKTSTSFASQKRTGADFEMPLPSYVQQYPASRVTVGCSCLLGEGPTYTQYRVCEQATTTTSYSTTFTYTVGKPGTITTTFTDTSTVTILASTTGPFPTRCPEANHVDYVATDKSRWDRLCGTGFQRYRYLDTVKAPHLDACIERCVDYNQKLGYKQCQGVSYDPTKNNCDRLNEVGYAPPDAGGYINIASLKFLPPKPTTGTDYCATVSGAAH